MFGFISGHYVQDRSTGREQQGGEFWHLESEIDLLRAEMGLSHREQSAASLRMGKRNSGLWDLHVAAQKVRGRQNNNQFGDVKLIRDSTELEGPEDELSGSSTEDEPSGNEV